MTYMYIYDRIAGKGPNYPHTNFQWHTKISTCFQFNCRIAKRSIAPPMLVTSLTAHVGPTNIVNTAVINMSDSMEIADGCSNFSPGRGSADLSSPGNLCEMLEYRYSKRHGENSKSERCSSRYFRSIFAVYPYTSPTSKSSCI